MMVNLLRTNEEKWSESPRIVQKKQQRWFENLEKNKYPNPDPKANYIITHKPNPNPNPNPNSYPTTISNHYP